MNQNLVKIAAGGVTALVVIGAIYLIYKRETKGKGFTQAPPPDQGSTGVDLTEQEAAQVRSLTNRLYNDLDGISIAWFAPRDIEAWQELNSLNDQLFTAVFNDFGNLYYSQHNLTLYQWMQEENFWFSASALTVIGRVQATRLKNSLEERFATLNLI